MNETKQPAIRFQGFSDEWEQRKLGEMASLITKGTTPLDKSNAGTVNYVKIESIDNSSGEITITQKISSEEHEGYLRRSQLKENDILFSIAGTLGRVTLVKSSILPANTNQALAIIRLKSGCLKYVKTYLKGKAVADFIKKNPTTGAQPNLSLEQVSNLEIVLPSKKEQEQIGSFFEQLDNLITLHQRKCEKLQTFKASMLEKMFPKDGKDMPEVRFKGFEKPWQSICLKDFTSEITRTDKTSEAPIMMITAANGFIDQSDRYAFNNAGQSLARYIVLKKGELAYNHGASKQRPYGSCFALEIDEARIPYVYHCFTVRSHNPYFVSTVLNGKQIEKQLRKLVTSGARMDGLLNISYEDYGTVKLMLPEREEQDRIAEYFKHMEKLTVLCQQELNKLQSIKKNLLEKMFV